MKTQKAGCILINKENKKVALVCRDKKYSFPKGHLEKGETIKECAIRETIEETGHDCQIVEDNEISKIEYVTSKGEEVEVHFYLAIDSGLYKGKIEEKDKEETVWLDIDKIEKNLSHENLKELWKSIKNQVENIAKT